MAKIVAQIDLNGKLIDVEYSPECITVYNSYKITKRKDMLYVLNYIQKNSPFHIDLFDLRKKSVLVKEWKAHNLLYEAKIAIDRTKDVDLDIWETTLRKIVYFALAIIYRMVTPLIKE